MIIILMQMLSIAVFGFIWQFIAEKVTNNAVNATMSRAVISALVYYFMLPALILDVLWQAPLQENSIYIAIMAAGGVLGSLLLALLFSRFSTLPRATIGAIILAASFPNATYMGLPVLEETFGSWSMSIALQYDMFACTPILLSLGIFIASSYGQQEKLGILLVSMLKVPAIWATLLAILLNLSAIPIPDFLYGIFHKMGNTVIPLMLFSLGLSLPVRLISLKHIKAVIVISCIQLLIMPMIVWLIGQSVPISSDYLAPVVIEGAMPSMLLGLVLCHRYKLDVGLYASAVTISSLASLLSLPLVLKLLV